MKDQNLIVNNEHEFMKEKSCLINLTYFCYEMTHLVVYLDFSKAFCTVCHNIFVEKQDKWTVSWVENWLICHAQRTVFSCTCPAGGQSLALELQGWLHGLTASLKIWMMEQSASLICYQVTQRSEGWQVHQMSVLTFTGTMDRLEKCDNRNLLKYRKEKCKVLHVVRNNPVANTDWLGSDWLESRLAKEHLGVWWTPVFECKPATVLQQGSDLSPLLSTGGVTLRMLGPVLRSPVRERWIYRKK